MSSLAEKTRGDLSINFVVTEPTEPTHCGVTESISSDSNTPRVIIMKEIFHKSVRMLLLNGKGGEDGDGRGQAISHPTSPPSLDMEELIVDLLPVSALTLLCISHSAPLQSRETPGLLEDGCWRLLKASCHSM